MKKYSLFLPVLFLSVIFFTSCNDDGCTDPAAANFDANADKDDGSCVYSQLPALQISISHNIAGAALQSDNLSYTNAAGNEYGITRLRYYISDVTLYTVGGDSVFLPYYQYIDGFEPLTLTATVTNNLPEGSYNEVKFNFGLTPRLNHIDSMPNDEPHISFTWPQMMGGGFHYMQLEGSYRHTSTETRFYNTHMGHLKNSTHDVNPTFSVKQAIAPIQSLQSTAPSTYVINIEADLNEWYDNPNSYNFADYQDGIMGNPQAQQILQQNGATVFTIKDVTVK